MQIKEILSNKGHSAYSILHQLLMAVFGFALLYVLFHFSSKEEAGRYLLFVSAISLADMLMHGFLQTPIIRLVSINGKENAMSKSLSTNIVFFASILWLIVCILIGSLSLFVHSAFMNDLHWYPVLGLLMIGYNVGWWLNHAHSDFRAILIQRLIYCAAVAIVLCYYFLNKHQLSTIDVIYAQIIGYISSVIYILFFKSHLKLKYSHLSLYQLKYYFNYGKYTAGSMIMGSLLRNADIFMIAATLGEGMVAVYSAAQKTVEIFEVALRGLAAHSLPAFCQLANKPKELLSKFRHTSVKLILAFLPFALLFFVFSKQIIHLVSGSLEYSQASIVLKIFMLYVIFLVVDRLTGITLEAFGMAKENFIKMIGLLVVNILGNAIALYYFESIAAVAVVSILATITGIIIGWNFLLKKTEISLSERRVFNILKTVTK